MRSRLLSATASVTAAGAASPDEVWDRYVHPARWPQWSHHFSRTSYPSDRLQPGVGGRAWLVGPLPLRPLLLRLGGVPARFQVDEVDETQASSRHWRWQLHLGPVTMRLLHVVRPDRKGSATDTTIWAPAPLLAGYLPVSKAALQRIVTP